MSASGSQLSQTDLLSWRLQENPILRPTIVAALKLDRDPDWSRLVAAVDRGSRAVPEFRSRLVGAPFGFAAPRWVPDSEFVLSRHLRRGATAPSSDLNAVLEFASIEAMTAFDLDRPLWRATLLSNVDDGASVLVLTVHHSLTDGVGGVRILAEMCDRDREGVDRDSPLESSSPETTGRSRGGSPWQSIGGSLRAVPRGLGHPLRSVRGGAAVAASLARLIRPVTTTLSPVMTARSTGRGLAVFDIPAEPLHRVAKAAHCTMNDAFLAAVLIGLRTYHDRHGRSPHQLRVTMPISLRTTADPLGGNRITLARFLVPVDIADPREMMRAVRAAVEAQRNERAIPFSGAVAAVLNRVPIRLIAGMLEHVDFVASNVPGPPAPLYLAGARIDRVYAFSPTLGTSFNVTLTTHAGLCCVGINADTAAVADLTSLTGCLAAGFDTVLRVGVETPGTARIDDV
ncbi:wax ester/triacylglycerol synthase domain-containing protein [Nocardia amikacinitolerans]|uniref:wax ester/triacylglycerol synthase domain-containing protein n=1 Tax=Nocardia amikacinitolerans TaxID=756689 RepID=UPI0020A3EEDA|nr:wax ester/triacylglycerol synthase domain-containing protein [Nocardia amikacinitolerans]MCP2293298.1 acyltransferase, WS/DGAT/MGAT [Nocardia amikacinitolerans]